MYVCVYHIFFIRTYLLIHTYAHSLYLQSISKEISSTHCFHPLDISIVMRLLYSMLAFALGIITLICFLQLYVGFSSSMPRASLVIFRLFNNSYACWSEMASRYGFNLNFCKSFEKSIFSFKIGLLILL